MLWSGMRVSAGSRGHRAPSLPWSSCSRSSGAKRHRVSSSLRQSAGVPGLCCSSAASKEAVWSKLRCLMSWKSVSPRPPWRDRSYCSPVSGWVSTGLFVQRTCAHGAMAKLRVSPLRVVTVISCIGHCGRSAAAAHQSARCTWRYRLAGMPFLNMVRTSASSLSGSSVLVSASCSPSRRVRARLVPFSCPAGSRSSTSAFSAGS